MASTKRLTSHRSMEDKLRQAGDEAKSLPDWMRQHVALAKTAYNRQQKESKVRKQSSRRVVRCD